MTATDLQRLIQIVTEEVIAAAGLGAPLARCSCHALNAECCPDRLRGVLEAGANRIGVHAAGGADRDVAGVIDHTLLRPDATRQDIEQLCREAVEFRFASVCVNPTWIALASSMLRPHGVGVCSVVGFPLGATTPDVKQLETRRAIFDGATEIDMVINIGALKSGDLRVVERDIAAVTDACQPCGVLSKVIIEAALLTDDEKISACALAKAAGADFVKTSTGFAKGGATVADVALMRRVVGPEMGVKAAGGVRDYEGLKAMVAAGASRVGASAGVRIVRESRGEAPATPGSPSY
jgi:deoxyribose-phosphate aldolase